MMFVTFSQVLLSPPDIPTALTKAKAFAEINISLRTSWQNRNYFFSCSLLRVIYLDLKLGSGRVCWKESSWGKDTG